MKNKTVIVAGAGAAGLMASRELLKNGFIVTILEGSNRIGGRINTVSDPSFPLKIECGAEFVHGDLELTESLLKEYRIYKTETAGNFYTISGKEYKISEDVVADHHDELEKRLRSLNDDITVEAFLQMYFMDEKYDHLRHSVNKFVEGFDTAEAGTMSALALKEEWLGMDEPQYRINGGYEVLLNAMKNDIINAGGKIYLNETVKSIEWNNSDVTVLTSEGNIHTSSAIILTFPPSIWLTKISQVSFSINPHTPKYYEAFQNIGYGTLIKFILLFDSCFWEDDACKKYTGVDTAELGFIVSDADVPTWWTQAPSKVPVLTGWLGGPAAVKYAGYSDQQLLELATNSLNFIFGVLPEVKAHYIINWSTSPFAEGSYSFRKPAAEHWLKILNEPVDDTVFLAGEALYSGKGMGTVEAALASGRAAAEKLMARQ